MSSSFTPGACVEINLRLQYETAFKYIEQARYYEKSNKYLQAQKMYIAGIESFMTIIKYETNISKKELIKSNVKTFIEKAEKIRDNNDKITPSAPPIYDENNNNNNNNNSIIIKVPIQATGINECIENEKFNIEISYNDSQLIHHITDKVLLYLNENIKYFPKQFIISYIDKQSFIGYNIFDNDDLLAILNKSIMDYNRYEIISKGIIIGIKIKKYVHKTTADCITCKYMTYKHKTHPNICPIYSETMYKNICSKNNLTHLRQFSHFKNEFIEKPECKFNEQCEYYIQLENGTNSNKIEHLCHVQLYRHPPRSLHRAIKLEKYMNTFIINTDWSDNYPIYAATEYDKFTYSYNKKDGFINALIEEVKVNGFCGNINDEILQDVNDKLNCLRHKAMASPLNRGEMLALILYTSCDCNYELCYSQRNGDYKKWKWFDYCLYFAIFNLSLHESGDYKLYSGLSNVKLNNKQIKKGYFVSYVSATWSINHT